MAAVEDLPAVLSHYPPEFTRLEWIRLGSAGGFSGAELWMGRIDGGPSFALKGWPVGYSSARLERVHQLMQLARNRGRLGFIPAVLRCQDGSTLAKVNGRIWDVTTWMPGEAIYHSHPSLPKLEAACAAVAAIHQAWFPPRPEWAFCPGIARRMAVLESAPAILEEARGCNLGHPTWDAHLRQALHLLPAGIEVAALLLQPWLRQPVPLHDCICDVRDDHVLYCGDQVTGIIDFGAVRKDYAAVDLARLLGDLVGANDALFQVGIEAYQRAGGPVAIDPELARALERSGQVCSVVRWVRELTRNRTLVESTAVLHRFERLVIRLAGLTGQESEPSPPVLV